ncbi:trimethylamine methyltransferase, partial [Gammaproteobacteria bacterium]|nr:trimethylamine methyltransferase [Gammaproteobacteria bacterium]
MARGGGQRSRQAMRERRAAPPPINPAPPGAAGGRYRPLTQRQVEQIFDCAMRMLAEIGLGEAPPILRDKARQ